MSLADRYYMRSESRRWRPTFAMSAWLVILIINVIVFMVMYGAGGQVYAAFLDYGALSFEGVKHGFIWQFLTFQFLHANLGHLFFNMLTLFFFARPLEEMLGRRIFLNLYLTSGVIGGVVQILFGLVFSRFAGAVVGASAGICGLIAAFALLNPDCTIYLMFILPIRAIYFLPLALGITILMMVIPSESHIANAAHLGGLLAGVAWIKLGWYRDYVMMPWERWFARLRRSNPLQSRQRKRELVRAAAVRTRPWRTVPTETEAELPPEEFISREVDPILDKISAHGIQSLTERERKILEAARKKMAKR
jgi:rhomboid family protein